MTDIDITHANRITLPGGAWADLRPVCDITERMRRPIKRLSAKLTSFPAFMEAVQQAEKTRSSSGDALSPQDQLALASSMGEAFDVLEELQDQLVTAATRAWSWDFPVTVDAVLDLPTPALDALRKAVSPYQKALNPNFQPNPDPASPTEPSSD